MSFVQNTLQKVVAFADELGLTKTDNFYVKGQELAGTVADRYKYEEISVNQAEPQVKGFCLALLDEVYKQNSRCSDTRVMLVEPLAKTLLLNADGNVVDILTFVRVERREDCGDDYNLRESETVYFSQKNGPIYVGKNEVNHIERDANGDVSEYFYGSVKEPVSSCDEALAKVLAFMRRPSFNVELPNIVYAKEGLFLGKKKADPVEVASVRDLFKFACCEVQGIETKMRLFPVAQYDQKSLNGALGLAKNEVVTNFCIEKIGRVQRYTWDEDPYIHHDGVSMIVRHSSKEEGLTVLNFNGGPLREITPEAGADLGVYLKLSEAEVRERIKSFVRPSAGQVLGR